MIVNNDSSQNGADINSNINNGLSVFQEIWTLIRDAQKFANNDNERSHQISEDFQSVINCCSRST